MVKLLLSAAIVVALAAGWLALEGRSGAGPLADAMGGRCTLGVVGAQATITITGPGARDECEQAVGFGQGLYVEDIQPTGGLVCRHHVEGQEHSVRDVGMTLVGSGICADLAEMAAPQE